MSQKKKTSLKSVSHRTGAEVKAPPPPPTEAQKRTGKKIKQNSVLLFLSCLIAMLAIFGARWVWAIMEEYYSAFVLRSSYSVAEAVDCMKGLNLSTEESAALLPLQREWDLFTSSRLRDEVTTTARDGAVLHGSLYNEGSDVTVVVLPRFDQDGTDDFLPGTWLYEQTGCNILLPDPRNHGESGGDSFTFGHLEQQDLVCWLEWAEEALGEQTFILWGEGVGANTILFAEAGGILPDSVAFAVAESPYASLHELANRQIWKWYTVPSFPFLNAIEWKVNHEDNGFQMKDTDLGSALEGAACELPVLCLESTVDEYILPEWSQQVYSLYTGEKQRISGGLGHGTVYAYCQEDVQAVVRGWIDSYIG